MATTERCRFRGGLDNYTNCATHGWSGGREEVTSRRVCPDAIDLDRVARALGRMLPPNEAPPHWFSRGAFERAYRAER